jgi:hypothetical protein
MTHWEIVHTSEVEKWLASTDMQLRRAVEMKVSLLRMYGPLLQRPHVDHIKGSRHSNMKELRITAQGPIRILFCFDPDRRAVLLIAGMKSSQKNWYQKMIPRADELMDQYLEERQ